MYYQTLQTCRFCKQQTNDGSLSMVKYGVRHYAHYSCYLDAGKKLSELMPHQVNLFPYYLLEERGLLDEATRICDKG